tara:strand:- start:13 stop:1161 length:1149 start_codon:yes stop_codon:yes gene_type:complete
MKIFYISPSSIPSKAANVVHVFNQVEGFVENGYEVEVFFRRKNLFEKNLPLKISNDYDIKDKKIKFRSIFLPVNFAILAFITLRSLKILFYKKDNLIISRNLYASLFYGIILNKKIVYETHTLERGIKSFIQLKIIKNKKIKTVVITKALKNIIEKKFKTSFENIFVLPDAAKSGLKIITKDKRKKLTEFINNENFNKYDFFCGYFGHLYQGRGIEIVLEIAKYLPKTLFIISGGNKKEIDFFERMNINNNVIFKGYCSHGDVIKNSRLFDALLMPYQSNVGIGIKNSDTSKWMSPMKMFEYMSTGVPIISSDLPVLREILEDTVNCLLSKPNDVKSWVENIIKLKNNKSLGLEISRKAFEDYKLKYTWQIRAKKLIEIYEK